METGDSHEWVILQVHDDVVAMEPRSGGREVRLRRRVLPDELASGDRFREIAHLDRRGPERMTPALFDLGAAMAGE